MPAIPASTKSSITLRVLDHAEARWPQLHKIETSYRGVFAYITDSTPPRAGICACSGSVASDSGKCRQR
jgi:hypothetical protein